jgi:hypothetical protein
MIETQEDRQARQRVRGSVTRAALPRQQPRTDGIPTTSASA